MRDQTFGELNYEFGWNGTIQLDCFGEKENMVFKVKANYWTQSDGDKTTSGEDVSD